MLMSLSLSLSLFKAGQIQVYDIIFVLKYTTQKLHGINTNICTDTTHRHLDLLYIHFNIRAFHSIPGQLLYALTNKEKTYPRGGHLMWTQM